jgi:hypothetical protein
LQENMYVQIGRGRKRDSKASASSSKRQTMRTPLPGG